MSVVRICKLPVRISLCTSAFCDMRMCTYLYLYNTCIYTYIYIHTYTYMHMYIFIFCDARICLWNKHSANKMSTDQNTFTAGTICDVHNTHTHIHPRTTHRYQNTQSACGWYTHPRTHTHAHTLSCINTLSHTYFLPLSLAQTLTNKHTHAHTQTLIHTHTLTNVLSHTHSRILFTFSHTHTHTLP